jgi:hypothetical protein
LLVYFRGGDDCTLSIVIVIIVPIYNAGCACLLFFPPVVDILYSSQWNKKTKK